jgi:hypothetical protein
MLWKKRKRGKVIKSNILKEKSFFLDEGRCYGKKENVGK